MSKNGGLPRRRLEGAPRPMSQARMRMRKGHLTYRDKRWVR